MTASKFTSAAFPIWIFSAMPFMAIHCTGLQSSFIAEVTPVPINFFCSHFLISILCLITFKISSEFP